MYVLNLAQVLYKITTGEELGLVTLSSCQQINNISCAIPINFSMMRRLHKPTGLCMPGMLSIFTEFNICMAFNHYSAWFPPPLFFDVAGCLCFISIR